MSETEIMRGPCGVIINAVVGLVPWLPQGFTLTYRVTSDKDSLSLTLTVPPQPPSEDAA